MSAKKIAKQMVRDPANSSRIFQDYVMAGKSETARRARFNRVSAELAKDGYEYVGAKELDIDDVAAGEFTFGEIYDPYSLRWQGLDVGPEFDIAGAHFEEALDQQHEFASLEEAFDVYGENAAETALEEKVNLDKTLNIYYELIRRHEAGREGNPTWLAVAGAGLAGAMAGAAGTFRGVGGNPSGEADYVELEEYEGAILMFSAEGGGVVGWAVNQCTGKQGYSHCALDVGLVNQEGEPLWIDSWALEGVGARPASKFEREPLRIPLTPSQASHARAVALHMLHEKTPYRGRYHGRTCSEFVVCCLPRSMLDEMKIPKNATPNDLAVAFGLIPKEENPRILKKKLLR